ncbi:hypothetical protein F5Y19DRAFT_478331 [Xylariaceae sp. FL1651]|nr:hypothetical protein F5Y19DRAFT_478331 [Xylariaceae sp. FL1651]
MATNREERMQQRMRGAGRHEVADESFGFVLPGAEASPDPPSSLPAIRSEPNTSAKRRRLNDGPSSANSRNSSATRSSTRLSSGQKPTQTGALPEKVLGDADLTQRKSIPSERGIPTRLSTDYYGAQQEDVNEQTRQELSAAEEAAAAATTIEQQDEDEDLETLPAPIPRAASRGSVASSISADATMEIAEEVTESPAAAPGSGHRRRIGLANLATQSAKLQKAVMEEEAGVTGEVETSSPLARKTRQSVTTLGTISARTTRASMRRPLSSPIEALHGSSPLARHSRISNSTVTTGSVRSTRSQNRLSTLSMVVDEIDELSSPPDAAGSSSARKPRPKAKKSELAPMSPEVDETEEEVPAEADDEEAEENNDQEAARQSSRKRPRISPQRNEPPDNLDSSAIKKARPAKKSRTKRVNDSLAQQSQPEAVKEKRKSSRSRRSDGDSIPVTVQRYTRPLCRNEGDANDDPIANIPYTDHKSPNVVDIVLQMCEESMEKYLVAVHEEAAHADGSVARKEFRTKLRTMEAFQEELRTRLETHTIALDNLRTLKKRVRATQKEKVSLRNEILRIRAEREQVALKIDAVRIRHETSKEEALYQFGLSSTMDDVELAIENGKAAPELNTKEEKNAGLANLDLLISQIASQVSATGDRGGILKQIKDFNAFLERAAIALEGR